MGLKNRISKFSGKMTKEKWLLLLLVGVLLMILSFPLPGSRRTGKDGESRSGQVSRNEGAEMCIRDRHGGCELHP